LICWIAGSTFLRNCQAGSNSALRLRSLAGDPPIILADEPTGALDSKTGVEIMDIFKRLNELGRTIIVITHDRQVAEQVKRVVRFRDGRLLN
jgi:putative ABC transport system ATP-binding protein